MKLRRRAPAAFAGPLALAVVLFYCGVRYPTIRLPVEYAILRIGPLFSASAGPLLGAPAATCALYAPLYTSLDADLAY